MPTSYLKHYWCDNAGLLRAKVEPNGKPASSGIGIAYAEQAQCATHRNLASGGNIGAIGDLTLIPDSKSYVKIPYFEKTFRVLGDMYENGSPWPLCPRHFLKRAIQDASEIGYEIHAAFEPEFYLFNDRSPTLSPIDQGLYSEAAHLDDLAEWMDFSLTSLEKQNVTPEGFHHESGPGQYEISIRSADALKAADDIIVLRDTIRSISRKFGLAATFCPKPYQGLPGTGLHLNLSLWRGGHSCVASNADSQVISKDAGHFISGILEGIESAVAMTCPSFNSHQRLHPGNWAGTSAYWNYADREAVIRVPRNGNRPITHLEFRALDATANPYMALASVIYLGLDGIFRKTGPIAPTKVVRPFPKFRKSMRSLATHPALSKKLGPRLLKAYLAVRISDYEFASRLGEVERSKLFVTRY
jgi:glutamine synthetase